MEIKNLNKSNNKEDFVCDFCGKSPDNLWEGAHVDGQYCFPHFRLTHEDLKDFDKNYNEKGLIVNE